MNAHRMMGATACVVMLGLVGSAAIPTLAPAGFTTPANAAEPAKQPAQRRKVLYYQAPMGPERSPVPRKDSMGMDYVPVYAEPAAPSPRPAAEPAPHDTAADRPSRPRILYYQAPMGPETSPVPKQDSMGMDYVPIYEESAPAPPPSPITPAQQPPQAAPPGKQQPRRILLYRAPMSADTSPVPKKDPMGMDYTPVYEGDASGDGMVTVSAERVQMLGVRTEAARQQVVNRPIRAVGTLAADERRVAVLAPRFEGWIQELFVNFIGQPVRRGQPMFSFYSPEIAAATREYLVARQMSGAIAEASATKLRNLGIPQEQIAALARSGKMAETVTLPAPIDGVVMEKSAVQGMRFAAGDALYRIADLSTLWVLVDVFEQDLAAVQPGQQAEIRLTAYPGRTFAGTVTFIYPTMNPATRTARIRIELPNAEQALKPDMYATVAIAADNAGRTVVAVPESAVLDGGDRQVVLVERGTGRYQPRQVVVGRHGDGYVEVSSGLAAGERVVVTANFLIDSESNLRGALQGFTAPAPEPEKRP